MHSHGLDFHSRAYCFAKFRDRFYLPKIAFAVAFFCIVSGLYGAVTVKQIEDPFYNWARRDSAEDFCRLKAPRRTAMAWIFIPAYCFALP